VYAANRLAEFVVGCRGYRAGVEYDQICFGNAFDCFEALGGESGFERCAIGLRGSAAEGF